MVTSYPGSFLYAPSWRKYPAGAGHVYPKFWVAKSIIAVGGVVEESVCRVWKIATLCFIVSGDKHALYNKKS